MSDIREDLSRLSKYYKASHCGDVIMSKDYCQEALDEINRLRGILHKIANAQRILSQKAHAAHNATREVSDMMGCSGMSECWDWYTFEGDDDE